MKKNLILAAVAALSLGSALFAAQQQKPEPKPQPKEVAVAPDNDVSAEGDAAPSAVAAKPDPRAVEAAERIEGEKRFRTNCGRCHQAPHKFVPRTMATIIRHMRVRATITDEDMRLILRYMTQ